MVVSKDSFDAHTPVRVRVDGSDKVSGEATYAYDLASPGCLEAKVVRSSCARARVRAIHAEDALAVPGVQAVITGDDLDALASQHFGFAGIKDQPILARGEVRHVGEAIALVVGADEASALAGVAAVRVDYERLPVAATIEEALGTAADDQLASTESREVGDYGIGTRGVVFPGPNRFFEFTIEYGDPRVLDRADHVFTDTFRFTPCQHFHLEPFSSTAEVRPGGVDVWTGTQNPFVLRKEIARILGRAEASVRVHALSSGGGFGARNGCRTEHFAAVASALCGRPVSVRFTLDESFYVQRQHGARITLETGVTSDGEVLFRDATVYLDSGAYVDASVLVTEKAGFRAAGPYAWKHVRSTAQAVLTNTPPAGPFRGFGGPQTQWASESQIDMIARRLGQDPVAFRERNLLRRGQRYTPTESPIDSSMLDSLARVQEWIDHAEPPSLPAGEEDQWRTGTGFAVGFKDAGGVNKAAQASVKLLPDGQAVLHSSTLELGQGAHTALSAVVSRVLGTPLERIRYGRVDTELSPFDKGTNASSAVAVMGSAVRRAAEDVKRAALTFAAEQLGRELATLTYRDGRVVCGPESWSLQELVVDAYGGTGFEFLGTGDFRAPSDGRAPLGTPCLYWETGAAAARVRVDVRTGTVEVTDLVTAADAGHMISEQLCHGQDEGAAVMSLARTLFEGLSISADGLLLSGAADYRVARATDLPPTMHTIVTEDGRGPGPFGARGFGEANMLCVPAAVCNAIRDAVGVDALELPVDPMVLWEQLEEARVGTP